MSASAASAGSAHPRLRRAIHELLCLALALTLAACSEGGNGECPANQVINTGHRGSGVNAESNPLPENTIESFREAVIEGATMIELDVALSADGQLVVMHDATLERTTNGRGCVNEHSLADLKTLDAATGTPLAGSGVTIPSFAEVLAAIDVDINVEIKIHGEACAADDLDSLAQKVIEGMAADAKERYFTVSSFDADVLTAVQALDSSVHLGLLSLVPADAELAAARSFQALNVFSSILRPGDVDSIREHGLGVAVWTENDPYLIELRLSEGVDMIISDEPDLVETVRREWCDSRGLE